MISSSPSTCLALSFRVFCFVIYALILCELISDSESREAINPNVDVVKELIDEYADNSGLPAYAPTAEPCTIDVQKDLPKTNESQPLYIMPGSNVFWLPNARGQLVVPHGAHIELHCPHKGMANVSTSAEIMPKRTYMLRVQCVGGHAFRWSAAGGKAEFKRFVCQAAPRYRVDRMAQTCGANGVGQLYRIGYNLTAGMGAAGGDAERFIETMQLCHDDVRVHTLYARNTLQPASVHFQKFVKRLNFSKAGGFAQLNVNHLYTQKNQRDQIAQLYGERNVERYLQERGGLYLARGHLVAKSDMIYASQQRSTFTFYNAAPQWQGFNGGHWATMEDQVRKFIARAGVTVHSYTGTWGTLQLSGAVTANGGGSGGGGGGDVREFYLARDANNNGLLPVPALFYRVLVTRESDGSTAAAAAAVDDTTAAATTQRRGIALVGVNNPHVNKQEINTSAYVLCHDIREQVPWLQRWLRDADVAVDVRKGYMYACRVDEFVRAVSDLPRELLNVSELLMAA